MEPDPVGSEGSLGPLVRFVPAAEMQLPSPPQRPTLPWPLRLL